MKHCTKTLIVFITILIMSQCLSSCSVVNVDYLTQNEKQDTASYVQDENNLTIKYIDVGQADSILVTCKNESMLIDGGNVNDGNLVCNEITSSSVTTINYLVNTHAHEDHSGGLYDVVNNFEVENAIISPKSADTKCYNNFIDALSDKGVSTYSSQVGETFMIGDAKATIIAPSDDIKNCSNLNNTSVVIKLEYKDKTILFMGDAEYEEEKSIMKNGFDVKCDILKAGHHGSQTSSSYVFLREAMPLYVVISVGENNSYGHPNDDTLSRFRDVGAKIYRTDKDKTVILSINERGNIKFRQ